MGTVYFRDNDVRHRVNLTTQYGKNITHGRTYGSLRFFHQWG